MLFSIDPDRSPALEPAAPARTRARVALALLFMLSFALSLGITSHFAWVLEEVAGVVPVAPDWRFPPDRSDPPRLLQSRGTLSVYDVPSDPLTLPVWGVLWHDRLLPIMVDGHQGGIVFYPLRAFIAVFGLRAGRVLSSLMAACAVLMVYALGRRFFRESAGWLGGLLVATSPLFLFVHSFARPDEQWPFFLPGLALLAMLRFDRTRQVRWVYTAALLVGLAMAGKNTTLWTVLAIGLSARIFRWRPGLSRRQWGIAALCGALPLVPQLLFVLLARSSETMWDRISRIPSLWQAFSYERVLDIGEHFIEAFTRWGDFLGPWIRTGGSAVGPSALSAVVLLVCTAGAVGAAFVRSAPLAMRAYGCALGAVLLQYWSFYYTGQSYYFLLIPWVLLGIAGTTMHAYHWAGGLTAPAARYGVRALVVVALGGFMVNQARQTLRYERDSALSNTSLGDQRSQRRVAADLERLHIVHPWTTTFTVGGVFETLSQGRVRPRHAYPFFAHMCGHFQSPQAPSPPENERDGTLRVWGQIVATMPAGTQHVLLAPRAQLPEVSPCESGAAIVEAFYATMRARGIAVRPVRSWYALDGSETFRLVAIEVPSREGP